MRVCDVLEDGIADSSSVVERGRCKTARAWSVLKIEKKRRRMMMIKTNIVLGIGRHIGEIRFDRAYIHREH